jgi:hypothetical protein
MGFILRRPSSPNLAQMRSVGCVERRPSLRAKRKYMLAVSSSHFDPIATLVTRSHFGGVAIELRLTNSGDRACDGENFWQDLVALWLRHSPPARSRQRSCPSLALWARRLLRHGALGLPRSSSASVNSVGSTAKQSRSSIVGRKEANSATPK